MIQDRLVSRDNFHAMGSLNEVSGIPKSIEEDSGRSSSALASLSALQFPGISKCPPRTKVEAAVTFPDDPRIIRNIRQRLYLSLAIREDCDADERNSGGPQYYCTN